MGLEDCVLEELQSLEKCLSTSKEKILKEVSRSRIVENNKYWRSKEKIYKEHQEKYEGKPFHGQFRKATEEEYEVSINWKYLMLFHLFYRCNTATIKRKRLKWKL